MAANVRRLAQGKGIYTVPTICPWFPIQGCQPASGGGCQAAHSRGTGEFAPLADYGGPTQTMAPLPNSPARNAASTGATTDQRGFPIVGVPDIGAYEAGTFTSYNAWIYESLPATATLAQHATTFDYVHQLHGLILTKSI